MNNQQLAVINFGQTHIQVYGTNEEPLFEINDVMRKILGYQKPTAQRWFRDRILCDPELVAACNQIIYLTEDGLYETLFASKQEIAVQFRKHVRILLKKIRKETSIRLLEVQKEIEELKAPKPASIYKIKQGNKLLYVGQDKSKAQNRPQQHFTERRKIAQNYQLIDIYLASQNEQDISIEVVSCYDYEADGLEKDLIEQNNPEFNQFMSGRIYVCLQCNPNKQYKNRGNYEKHLIEKH